MRECTAEGQHIAHGQVTVASTSTFEVSEAIMAEIGADTLATGAVIPPSAALTSFLEEFASNIAVVLDVNITQGEPSSHTASAMFSFESLFSVESVSLT